MFAPKDIATDVFMEIDFFQHYPSNIQPTDAGDCGARTLGICLDERLLQHFPSNMQPVHGSEAVRAVKVGVCEGVFCCLRYQSRGKVRADAVVGAEQ